MDGWMDGWMDGRYYLLIKVEMKNHSDLTSVNMKE